jgi:phospholipase C
VSAPDIEHVVVVMFENRSFDHLLGLLSDDPAFPGVRLEDEAFSNPVDPDDPSQGRVPVTGDATARDLTVDPPHSHASVVEQLDIGWHRRPRMDGFVAAYRRKLAGDEAGLPVVHWERLYAVGGATSVVVAGVLALPAGAPLAAGGLGLVAVLEGVVRWAHRRRRSLPVDSWAPAFVAPVVAVAAGGVVSAGLGRFVGYKARVAVLGAALATPGALAIRRKRRALRRVPGDPSGEARRVMRCLRPAEHLPALATLASSFALCTRWHCSVPGATWPNRNFAHAGTSDGTVDIELGLYDNDTIFRRLQEAGRTWSVYRDHRSLAQVMAFGWMSDEGQIKGWRRLDEFVGDVDAGRLASYSFLEPCHDGPFSNSQHPGNNDQQRRPGEGGLWDFERGENLIVEVYEALRRNPELFARTILVITYDEHGGLYDHVPPPTDAVEPEPFGSPRRSWSPRLLGWFVQQPESRFRFKVLGPRVPTVVVSPRIPQQWDDTLYDHTAIPRTLRSLFAPGAAPLSAREDASATFGHLASLDEARTDLPDLSPCARTPSRPAPAAVPPRNDEFACQLRQLGAMLRPKLLAGTRARLPDAGAAGDDDDVAALFTARAEEARRR